MMCYKVPMILFIVISILASTSEGDGPLSHSGHTWVDHFLYWVNDSIWFESIEVDKDNMVVKVKGYPIFGNSTDRIYGVLDYKEDIAGFRVNKICYIIEAEQLPVSKEDIFSGNDVYGDPYQAEEKVMLEPELQFEEDDVEALSYYSKTVRDLCEKYPVYSVVKVEDQDENENEAGEEDEWIEDELTEAGKHRHKRSWPEIIKYCRARKWKPKSCKQLAKSCIRIFSSEVCFGHP